PRGGVRCGLADTIERRRGEHSAAQGLYRAPVRSSHAPFGKVSGLRWRGGMLLPPMPWAHRLWALPWITVLGPSERFDAQRGAVFVADRRCAARDWLALGERFPRVRVSTRLRLDAALSAPPPPRAPGQSGRPRLTGKRRPPLETVWADEQTRWSTLTVDDWEGDGPYASSEEAQELETPSE